jgi:hypothetical protein
MGNETQVQRRSTRHLEFFLGLAWENHLLDIAQDVACRLYLFLFLHKRDHRPEKRRLGINLGHRFLATASRMYYEWASRLYYE